MNELSKAIETLEGLKSLLEAKHKVYQNSLEYAGVDLSEAIGETEQAIQLLQDSLQRIQRLQTLQPKDVTLDELENVTQSKRLHWHWDVNRFTIAAVCRGMLLDGNE